MQHKIRIKYNDTPESNVTSLLKELGIEYYIIGGDGWIEICCPNFPQKNSSFIVSPLHDFKPNYIDYKDLPTEDIEN